MTDREIYERQIAAEVRQFVEAVRHENSPASLWWFARHHAPRLEEVFGTPDIVEAKLRMVAEAVERTGLTDVISLGAADGLVESQLLREADRLGLPKFRIHALEISPVLVERAQRRVRDEGLEDRLLPQRADLNQGLPQFPAGCVAAVLVSQVLHHVVELERLYADVRRVLHPQGVFMIDDVVGRNGHRRWPEVLGVMREIWQTLPMELRYDHAHGGADLFYEDWDYSTEGFEGVRAQDVAPLLLEHFDEDRSVVWGAVAEIVFGASYGANFDPKNPTHRAFIDEVQNLEDRLIDGRLTSANVVFGAFRPRRPNPPPPRLWNGRGAQHTLRPPKPGLHNDIAALGFTSPFPPPPMIPLVSAPPGDAVGFGAGRLGQRMLRWGWSGPEDGVVWGIGAASALAFICRTDLRRLKVATHGYLPPNAERQDIAVRLNGKLVGFVAHSPASMCHETSFDLPPGLLQAAGNLLEFETARFRLPDLDGGDDLRPLSLALIAITLG